MQRRIGATTLPPTAADLPDFDDVLTAARRLHGVARVTPLLEAQSLNTLAGRRVLIKAECLQRTGTFKFRGAYNKIAGLPAAGRRAGVLAWSSGNHAQGVAAAAAMFGISAKIVMPRQAPAIKIERTRALDAEVVLYDIASEDREAIGREIAAAEGRTVVPPYDDRAIIAGQGTVGNELANQCLAAGVIPDAVVIPCGGGGLSAGAGLAVRRKLPAAAIYLAEPEGFDDTARSLRAGRREQVTGEPSSICDALLAWTPGELTFALNRTQAACGLIVTDDQVRAAMKTAWEELKIVLEPGGAAALAAVLAGGLPDGIDTAVVVASGGNVDPDVFGDAVSR